MPDNPQATSPGSVVSFRAAVELTLSRVLESGTDEFIRGVIDDAGEALSSPVLVAAGGRKPDPFAFTNVMKRWYAAVREMAGSAALDGLELSGAELVEILERSDLPSDLFEKVSDILRTARDESWTEYRTKRHLSKELIPKESSGWWSDRAAYRHSIRRTARTLSTQNASVRVSRELREQGFTHKRWVSVMDSRVRSTHAEANGQTVPLGESFSVGAYGLRYPGDPQGPDVEIQNCRCVIVGVGKDGEMGTTTLTAAGTEEDEKSPDAGIEPVTSKDEGVGASLPQGWSGPIGMEQTMTGDGRLIEADALQWETPIPLRYVPSDLGAHDGAQVVGTIQEIAREEDGRIVGTGTFDLDSEIGREAARHVFEGLTRGVSMDLDDVSFEVRVAEDVLNSMEAMMDGLTDDEDGEEAEAEARAVVDGKVVMMEVNSDDEVHVTKSARIRAATIVAIPAFAEAVIMPMDIAASVDEADEDDEVEEEELEEEPDESSLVAGGGPDAPPRDWFSDPQLSEPTPIVVQADGRVFGHLATWDSCHIAHPDFCTSPPTSQSGYAYFHTGSVLCEDGSEIGVGHLTLNTTHAPSKAKAAATLAHYENTGLAAADVRAGEDQFGIWVAGSVRPGLSAKKVRALRAAPLSGDWRRIQGNLELVAALAVNVPGFPIPRTEGLTAGGHTVSLVASGMVPPKKVKRPGTEGALSPEDLRYLKALARRERRNHAANLAARARAGKVHDFAKKITPTSEES